MLVSLKNVGAKVNRILSDKNYDYGDKIVGMCYICKKTKYHIKLKTKGNNKTLWLNYI